MTFLDMTAALAAAARFDAAYGGAECYAYRFQPVARGFQVAVHSTTSGVFLTYV